MWWLIAASALAQDVAFEPELQVRPRVEAHTGRDAAPGGDALFVSQRARLGATVSSGPLFLRAVVQDVRLWGEEEHTLLDWSAEGLDLHHGTVGWRTEAWTVEVGRQELGLNEQRLLGSVDWTQQARSFDAARVAHRGSGWVADGVVAVIAEDQSATWGTSGLLTAARLGLRPAPDTVLDLVYVGDRRGDLELQRHTAGPHVAGATGILSGRVEAYGQLGTLGDRAIRAWMVGLRGTLDPGPAAVPSVTLWYDHLSGDPDPDDAVQGAFDTLYATDHKFYGLMDVLLFAVGGPADGRGLQDAALKLASSPVPAVDLHLDAHLFLASAPRDADPVLGQEVDLWGSWAFHEQASLGVGGALLRRDAGLDGWAWVQLGARL